MLNKDNSNEKPCDVTANNDLEKIWNWNFLNWRTLVSILSCKWRLTRWEYWLYTWVWMIWYFLCCFLLWFFVGFFVGLFGWNTSNETATLIAYLMLIPYLYRSICINIWRAHDRWKPGSYIILLLLPIINLFAFVELCFWKSENKTNKFWKEPHKVSDGITVIGVALRVISILIMIITNSL